VPDVPVAIIGTQATQPGAAPIETGTRGITPDHQPNLIVQVVTPIVALVVRFVNMYLTTFLGLLTLAGVTGDKVLPVTDLESAVRIAAWGALVTAAFGLVKNLVTIFGKLEGKFPLLTGSI